MGVHWRWSRGRPGTSAVTWFGRHTTRGYRVRALVRDEARLADARPFCDDVFVGQATDPATLAGLFEGADVAFSSLGTRHFRRRPTFWEVDAQANLNLVQQAERAGVRRFVFVSVLGAPELRHRVPVAEARERVVDRLRTTAMSYAVIRPNGFYNDMLEYLRMAEAGRVWIVGDGRGRFNPIHGADLADVCVEAFSGEHSFERDVGGPETVSPREVGRLAFEAVGRPERYGVVPVWLLWAIAAVVYPFNKNLGAFLKMFAAFHDADELVAPGRGTHRLAPFFAAQAPE